MIYLTWSSDIDINDINRTETKPLIRSGLYHFVCDGEPKVVSASGNIEINIFYEPKLHWKRFTIPIHGTKRDVAIFDETHMFKVSLEFSLDRRFSTKEGFHVVIILSLIELEIIKQDRMLGIFLESEKHKIVLQSKIKSRRDMMSIRSLYFGRAQEISTTKYGGRRTYAWTSTSEQTFKGIGIRSAEDLDDIRDIQTYPLLSPREKDGGQKSYEPDNDAFSNKNMSLPIDFNDGEAISLQVFNLKFNPPKFIELQLRWIEFLGCKEKKYHVVYDRDTSFDFEFHIESEKKVIIRKLSLHVNRYITVLNTMGDNKSAKTV